MSDVYVLITEFADGERDVELFASKPTFRPQMVDEVVAWELRRACVDGGDSVVAECAAL